MVRARANYPLARRATNRTPGTPPIPAGERVMIEFRCQQCGATLRVPAGTEGKQAKCPQCSALMTIPTPPGPPGDPFRPAPTPPGPADFSAPPPREGAFHQAAPQAGPAADPNNPFQSPHHAGVPYRDYPAATRGFQPSPIEFGRTFDLAWKIFKANMGMLIAAALVGFGISMGLNFVTEIVRIALLGFDNRDPDLAMVAISFLASLANGIIQTFLTLGLIRITLNAARHEPVAFSDLFSQGRYLIPTIVANLIFGFAVLIGLVLLVVPGIWVALALCLFWYMIIDQNAGIVDSLRMSHEAMRGNKLTLLGIGLASFGLMLVIAIPTCFLGMIFLAPFLSVVWTVVYLGATGQLAGGQFEPAPYRTP